MDEASLGRWTRPAHSRKGLGWLRLLVSNASPVTWYAIAAVGLIAIAILVDHFLFGGRQPFTAFTRSLVFFMAMGIILVAGQRPESKALREWRKSKPEIIGAPVAMTIFRGDEAQGQSEGVVRFEDGALVFEGLSTSFVLRAEDVFLPDEVIADGPSIKEKRPVILANRAKNGSAWGFLLKDHPEWSVRLVSLRPNSDLGATLFEWLIERPESNVTHLLPPLERQPGFTNALV